MKRILRLVILTCLLAGLLCPGTVTAASRYAKTYTTSGTACEKPEDLFKNPYCYYKGTGEYEGIEVWAEKEKTVKLPMDGVFARDVLIINKTENYVSMED
ncbi:MAG: hypothetical protein ACI4LC_06645 [Emergencia sp.]